VKLSLELDFDWAPVTCADGSIYAYSKPVRNVRQSFHFGECDDLVKELNASVNPAPGHKSAGRIKAALGERMLLGQAGVVDVLKVRSLKIGGAAPPGDPLRDRNIRRAVESLLIHGAAEMDVELLNLETSPRDLLSLL
jgi:hypothetical protein